MESDTHISGSEATLGEEAYRKVFNGSILEGVDLVQKTKAIKEMTDEELTAFIYEMEDFVRRSRIVAQAARINLEDRKLRYTEEQLKALRELDKVYKPKPISTSDEGKRERKAAPPKDPFEKKLAALIDIMGMTADQAVEYLAAKGITRENCK